MPEGQASFGPISAHPSAATRSSRSIIVADGPCPRRRWRAVTPTCPPGRGTDVRLLRQRRRPTGSTPVLPPFSFVDDVAKAIAAAREFVGDRDVDVATGQIGSQALKLGLIDQFVLNVVPVVFGSGRPFFATGTLPEPLELENPTTIVPGDRVTTWPSTSGADAAGCTTGLKRSRGLLVPCFTQRSDRLRPAAGRVPRSCGR